MKKPFYEEVVVDKLVHGGQGLASLADGRKAFIWNSLPGEKVRAKLFRTKKDYAEGIAEEVITSSPDRVQPAESIYLATSPWQIMTLQAENQAKAAIVSETFSREKVKLPNFTVNSDGREYNYRNKMEFSFYGDDQGLHYAFYNRGSHQKQIVQGSKLAMPPINPAAADLLVELNKLGTRAGELKSVVLRCTQQGEVVGALFVKPTTFPKIHLPGSLQGLKVYHSNPRSPASVTTKLLTTYGDSSLHDKLLDTTLEYDVTGFFQVNVPVFEQALRRIKSVTSAKIQKIDLYSGVGSIGISLAAKTLVELDPANVVMAQKNAVGKSITVIQASTEKALEVISDNCCLIVDPPRSGLHKAVIARILEIRPQQVCYLSCNPATQARDVALLGKDYKITAFDVYNFFPRTPHIESLILLEKA